ncbi:MAG: LamG domain-containing protein, partial [Sedimentisphaerales bacterium]|nr:LamG domain-containing protein [Sedimentisphaerales bacterium]
MFRQSICLISLILIMWAIGNAEADLVGRWRLDGNAADSSGGGHDGEIFGDPKWVDGKIGGAMELDGDDWIEMPGTSAADGFAGLEGEVTWTAWFKTSAAGVINTLMAQGPAGAAHVQGNRSINIEASGVIMIRAHSVGALTSLNSTAVVNDGQWHHVAVTIAFETDGANDTMKVYIDGDLSMGYETDTVDINQHSGPAADFIVTLGARGTTPFVGLIDDVRIYDHVLSEVEILSAMEGKPWPYAFGPNPANGALYSNTSAILSWSPGETA